MKRALALVLFVLPAGCSVSGPDADTYRTRFALRRIENAAFHMKLHWDYYRPRIDFTAMFRGAFRLDAYGNPETPYPSISTRLAPTPSWGKYIQELCRNRGGNSSGYRGGRFEPFRCWGPPSCDEYGVREGSLLFEVSFSK